MIVEFFGRFHPLVVHLPIGILLLVFFFEWMVTRPRWEYLEPAIPMMLWIGTAAAGLACVTGLLLQESGDYSGHIDAHEWLGLSLFFLCVGYAYFRWLIHQYDYRKWVATAMFVVLTVTGHLGGSLTHGEDYLTAPVEKEAEINWAEAVYYDDVIEPLLKKRCVSCHGPNKQKGELRLDGREWMLRGGEHGSVLVAGDSSGSELLKRVLLPLNHEDHMPPREKTQLTSAEVAWLEDWINTGASFEKKVRDVSNPEKFLTARPAASAIPNMKINPAPPAALRALQQTGATVIPVSNESNFLQVALTNTKPSDSLIDALAALREHIVWLKADCRGWKPAQINALSRFPNLTKWWLNQSGLTDDCLLAMEPGASLRYLNLTGTAVTQTAVEGVLGKRQIPDVYLFQTAVTAAEIAGLRKKFPGVRLEGEGYQVPTLSSDTTEVK